MSLNEHKRNLVRFLTPILGVTLLVAAPSIQAQTQYLVTWGNIYQGSTSGDNAACALCHTDVAGGAALNPYGSDIAGSGNIVSRIQAVEGLDSDGDPTGCDNLAEINANTQPGWTATTVPPDVTGAADPASSCNGNQAPTADANGPYTGTAGELVQFDGSGSNDPDGFITAWDWTFGDGNIGTGESPVHTYDNAGIYDVTLVVTS